MEQKTKKVFSNLEKMLYGILVMLTIVIITFLSYLTDAKFYLCPIILVLELAIFLCTKSKRSKNYIESLLKDDKKLEKVRKIVYTISIIFTILFVILVGYVIYNIINIGALAFLFELLSVNIISFLIFVVLICSIFVINRKDDTKEEENEIVLNKVPGKKLLSIVYSLFILITCVIPFAYVYFGGSEFLMAVIWVIGCLSNLLFGVLTSAILRTAEYHNMSFAILGLSILFVCMMGIFSQFESIALGYVLFLISALISLLSTVLFNKNNKICSIILAILTIIMVVLQIMI